MNKQMQKSGFKNNFVRFVSGVSLLALVLFGQVASASTRFYDYGGTGINYLNDYSVNYADAQNFCSGTGLRLPTQAEILADYNGANQLDTYYYWTSTVSTNGHYVVGTNVGNSLNYSDTSDTVSGMPPQGIVAVCIYDTDLLAPELTTVASFFSDTNAFDNLSTVTSDTFSSVVNWLYIILGVVIAFFVIEKIISIIPNKDTETDRKTEQMIARGTAMKEKIDKLPE